MATTLNAIVIESFVSDGRQEKPQLIENQTGTAYFKSGHVYKGEFSKGKMDGKGEFTWRDGVSYVGDLSANKITGKGVLKWYLTLADKLLFYSTVFQEQRQHLQWRSKGRIQTQLWDAYVCSL
jgi:hypothetical protein